MTQGQLPEGLIQCRDLDSEAKPETRPPRSFQVLVVLPAYNEEANIGRLLQRIARDLTDELMPHQIIVVNDGSTDCTAQIVAEMSQSLPITVVVHYRNQGLGAAIRDGLAAAIQIAGPNDIIVTMDADETHSSGLIGRMVREIREGRDVVVASRYQPGAAVYGLTMHRKLIGWLSSIFMRCCFPTRGLRDYTCGFRAYRAASLQMASQKYGAALVDQEGFQCMVDLLLKLRRLPVVFGEVPMILRYDFKQSASKMRLASTAGNTLRLVLRRRLGR